MSYNILGKGISGYLNFLILRRVLLNTAKHRQVTNTPTHPSKGHDQFCGILLKP